ncbi:zinc-dependent metalloprotease [Polaribacter sp.]|uniref:zinc-dependent metalloprotease n=1 Tax=Polaribacter sp. TaxID=1920175 RepID=UPI004047D1A0
MKNFTLILLVFLSVSLNSFSQVCGTPSLTNYNENEKIKDSFLKSSNSICINVLFHIVRQSNGTGGFNSNLLTDVTNKLNLAFNQHNLYINNLGFDYIDNSIYYNIDDVNGSNVEFDGLVQINNNPNAINVYIVNSAASYAGRANGILSQALVIESSWANTQVISHEVGHCLNLWHTFQGTATNTSGCAEAINGSNCTTCGDLVCDTPADANTGNSGGYSPDLDNIMSYYYPFNNFTVGQSNRIRQAFARSSILQAVISDGCIIPKITGESLICYDSNITYNLTNGGTNVTWQVSSNLQIVSSNNSSITVTPINLNTREEGFIKAVLVGQTIEKYVWVGKPDAYTVDSNGVRNYMGGSFYFQQQNGGRGQFSVFSDFSGGTWNWTGPNNNSWWQINRNTVEIDLSNSGSYFFTAEFSNDCGTHYYFVFVNIGGIEPDFMITPNPVSDNFTISKTQFDNSNKLNEINSVFELYDFNSNLKIKSKFKEYKNVNVSHLKKGIYILRIITDKKVEHHRIIIE